MFVHLCSHSTPCEDCVVTSREQWFLTVHLESPGKPQKSIEAGFHIIPIRDGDVIGLECGLDSGIVVKSLQVISICSHKAPHLRAGTWKPPGGAGKPSRGPHPTVADAGDLGHSLRILHFKKFAGQAELLVWEFHFENHGLSESEDSDALSDLFEISWPRVGGGLKSVYLSPGLAD